MKKDKVRSYFKDTTKNFMVPHEVIENPRFQELKVTSKWLYTCLCKVANRNSDDEGWFYHSIQQLVNLTGMNKKTIIKAKRELSNSEFIVIKRGIKDHTGLRAYDFFRLNGFIFKVDK